MIRFKQIKGASPVWVNPGHVAQVRPSIEADGATAIVFSTGSFVEVEGTPHEVVHRLIGHE